MRQNYGFTTNILYKLKGYAPKSLKSSVVCNKCLLKSLTVIFAIIKYHVWYMCLLLCDWQWGRSALIRIITDMYTVYGAMTLICVLTKWQELSGSMMNLWNHSCAWSPQLADMSFMCTWLCSVIILVTHFLEIVSENYCLWMKKITKLI